LFNKSGLIENRGDKPLLDLLNRLGGWPVLKPEEWIESDFNWFETYINLRKIGLVDNILISIFVDSDDRNSSKRSLYVRELV
jgi:hypothetical protein